MREGLRRGLAGLTASALVSVSIVGVATPVRAAAPVARAVAVGSAAYDGGFRVETSTSYRMT